MESIGLLSADKAIYKTKRNLVIDDKLVEIKKESEEFKSSISKLSKSKTDDTSDNKLARNIKKYVKEYNALKKKIDEQSDSKIKKEMSRIEETLTENKKELKKMGISITEKGYMSFDSSKIKEDEKIDLDKLFYKNDSIISNTFKIVRKIENYAEKNSLKEEFIRYKQASGSKEETEAIIDMTV